MDVPIQRVDVSAYQVPTDFPESDGTAEWDSTTLVLVEITAGGKTGLGYTYADSATARLIDEKLKAAVEGGDAFRTESEFHAMEHKTRNLGHPGMVSMGISAVDVALWDLRARLLDIALFRLLGAVRESVAIYGSGGFTSYSKEQLREQLGGWVAEGIGRVKMKIGRDAEADLDRVAYVREAIGPNAELFVDANGAYDRKQALAMAEAFVDLGVNWFEEPVSSDDLEGLRLLRDRGPAGMDIAAGEYGYDLFYFRRMLDAQAVDVLQIDGTRAGGITGFQGGAALCAARPIPVSAHCAPSIHGHACCAALKARHIEYFHDHVRIEHLLFDGALSPINGELRPDPSRPGLGLEFKRSDAKKYLTWSNT